MERHREIPRIQLLPAYTSAQVQSSKTITSLQDVVFGLVCNSLDAEAGTINVSIFPSRSSCIVGDNGQGIASREFEEDGGLCRMYCTSRVDVEDHVSSHGFSGTFLASLSSLAFLRITSRSERDKSSASMTVHRGKVLLRQSNAGEDAACHFPGSHGTEVVVNDIFGNIPVRLRQRELSQDLGRVHDQKVWADLKHRLVALLLAWRRPCIVKLRDAEDNSKSVTLSTSHQTAFAVLTEQSLNHLHGAASRFGVRDVLPVVFQAGFADHSTRANWIPVSASTMRLKVCGMICTEPAASKACQFVSIGSRPCDAADGDSEIYGSIKKIFENSSFGVVEDEQVMPDEAELLRRKGDRRFKVDGHTMKSNRGTKGVDRWPMFVLQIQRKQSAPGPGQNVTDSEKERKSIIEVLEAMVRQWLTAQGCRPRKKRRRADEWTQKPAAAQRVVSQHRSTFHLEAREAANTNSRSEMAEDHLRPSTADSLSRIKAGRRTLLDVWESRKPRTAPHERLSPTAWKIGEVDGPESTSRLSPPVDRAVPLQARSGNSSNLPNSVPALVPALGTQFGIDTPSSDQYGCVSDSDLLAAVNDTVGSPVPDRNDAEQACEDHTTAWTDPRTGQAFTINTRTGVVLPQVSASSSKHAQCVMPGRARQRAAIDTATTSAGRPLTLARRVEAVGSTNVDQSSRLPDWNNPVFAIPTEVEIPVALVKLPSLESGGSRCSQTCHGPQKSPTTDVDGESSVTKAALRCALVVRQVDRKYILARVPCANHTTGVPSEMLVIIDQHAASERVMLEGLLTELCTPTGNPSGEFSARSHADDDQDVRSAPLDRPIIFEISAGEYDLFAQHQEHFAHWGIVYEVQRHAEVPSASQARAAQVHTKICVLALPPVILERCKLFPKLLIEMLRGEIWTLADISKRPTSARSAKFGDAKIVEGAEENGWLRRIGSCPRGLLEMLNSRACRSAIMFNDVLSVKECQDLVDQLGRCAFPFMCAHGRVSMAPLVRTIDAATLMVRHGGLRLQHLAPDASTRATETEARFADAYDKWNRPAAND